MIIWGTKIVYRKLGHVADFCPLCIGARAFSLERIGAAGHVYYVTVGDGDLVDYQRVCLDCHNIFRADPEHYATISKTLLPLPDLIKETFPNLAAAHKERLVLESKIRSAPLALPDDVRRNLIMEPFLLLSAKVTDHYKNSSFQIGGAFIQKEIVPTLGQTLARLHPTEHELQATLTRLAQLKHQIGTKVKLKDIVADVNGRLSGQIQRRAPGTSRPNAGNALDRYQKAARAFRWLSYLQGGLALILLFSLVSSALRDKAMPEISALGTFLAIAAVAAGFFVLSKAILQRKNWARIAGIIAAIAMLFGFPIGTLIGVYVLINLIKDWDDGAPAPRFA